MACSSTASAIFAQRLGGDIEGNRNARSQQPDSFQALRKEKPCLILLQASERLN